MDPFSIAAAAAIVVLVIVLPVIVLSRDVQRQRQDPGYRSESADRTR
jgi:hypothetical protein